MSNHRSSRGVIVALVAAFALLVAACSDDSDGDTSSDTTSDGTTETSADEGSSIEGELAGELMIDAGECDDAGVASGSYFRMIGVGGTIEDGPFIENADSTCSDTTFLLMEPGTDGGLVLGDFQPAPDPAFDDAGNGLADAILVPAPFFGVDFAFASAETDPQTGETVPAPSVTATDGELSGDMSAMGAFYGGELFNQGSPKPDGSMPGLTAGPEGTIDADTGEYVIEWTSQIVGGPFNEFTGVWHFEGTFAPA
jgi:hypothetical protein